MRPPGQRPGIPGKPKPKAALKRPQSKRWRVDQRVGSREAFGVRAIYRRFR